MVATYKGKTVTWVKRENDWSKVEGEPYGITEEFVGAQEYVTVFLHSGLRVVGNSVEQLEFTYAEEPRRGIKLEPGTELKPGDTIDVYYPQAHFSGFEELKGLVVRGEGNAEPFGRGYIFERGPLFRLDVKTWGEQWDYEVYLVQPRGERILTLDQLQEDDIVDIVFPNGSFGVEPTIYRDQEVETITYPSEGVTSVETTLHIISDQEWLDGGDVIITRTAKAKPKAPKGVPFEEIARGNVYEIYMMEGDPWIAPDDEWEVKRFRSDGSARVGAPGGGVSGAFNKEWIDEGRYSFVLKTERTLPEVLWITGWRGERLEEPVLVVKDGEGDYVRPDGTSFPDQIKNDPWFPYSAIIPPDQHKKITDFEDVEAPK